MAADTGMIGISGTNARPTVAPTFIVGNMLGTNPSPFAHAQADKEFHFFPGLCHQCESAGARSSSMPGGVSLPLERWPGMGRDGKSRPIPTRSLEDHRWAGCLEAPLGGDL